MDEAHTISRRQARRDAMVVLYQHDITGAAPEELYNSLRKERGHEASAFTRDVVEGVLADVGELDAEIDVHAIGWPAHRMAALERNILRIGLYEIRKRGDIPVEVSIDEAVRLSKRFCSREAAALINGILGKVAEEERGAPEDDN
ncbi:MAG: transcription antitermination factor NusB [Thermoleophilia bacterium]|nr:transcription antitermination factor NusB [Thermoleophilia bacterium]